MNILHNLLLFCNSNDTQCPLIYYNSGSGGRLTAFRIKLPLHFRIEEGAVCSFEVGELPTRKNTKCHNAQD